MQYYSDYSRTYVQSMCDALNEGGFTTLDENLPFVPENLSSITELLEDYAVYSASKFNYLNQKGLINTGRCPYTGESIGQTDKNYTYFGRSVFVSNSGLIIMLRESAAAFEKTMGYPKPTKPIKGGGCYIASVCYGDAYAPEVVSLRIFRDLYLMRKPMGRLFVKIYYFTSPTIADILGRFPMLNNFVKQRIMNNIISRITKL